MEESVTMKNKAQLYARRREMYRLHVQKLNITEILDKLSANTAYLNKRCGTTGKSALSGFTTSLISNGSSFMTRKSVRA